MIICTKHSLFKGLSKDHEEEGVEDDTNDDFIDPWGIINKPLKVVNQRSHWVSEALFGKYVSIGNKINNEIFLQDP